MKLYRLAIGIQFKEKMFRLPSLGGLVIDNILKLRNIDKLISEHFFTKISTSIAGSPEYTIIFLDDKNENELTITHEQFVFKKTATNKISAINKENAIKEFEVLWKTANKILLFNETRRIGLSGEYRIKESTKKAGNQFLESLTKIDKKENCSKFQLLYETRESDIQNQIIDPVTSDFWNKIFTFFISENEENTENGSMNANLDIQKYYNPAKKDPLREINNVLEKFKKEKEDFTKKLTTLGISEHGE